MKKSEFATKTNKRVAVAILFIISLICICIATGAGLLGWSYFENQSFKETFYSVSSLKVNNKIRVIQISDLHNCSFGNENQKLIDRVKKLKPDLIVYTGDSIDKISDSEDNIVSLCKTLAEVAPSYFIFGNNEVERYYDIPLTQDSLDEKFGFNNENRDPVKLLELSDNLTEKLEKVGVKVLKNSQDTITIGTTTVDVFGVLTSNPSSFWSYGGNGFDKFIYSSENNLKLMLVHEPQIFEEFTPDTWGDLMLAGHTHGGTAKIPIIGPVYTHEGGVFPARNGHFVYGRYDVQGRPLIVSSGLENTNLLRFNNQPELVIVDVNKF